MEGERVEGRTGDHPDHQPGPLSPKAPMPVSLSQYLYVLFRPLLNKVHVTRRGSREFDPQDILLPEGYTAEIVVTGLNDPVHCCFDDQGYCYVTECGHKIGAKPRILKVDPENGEYDTYFELPEERWEFVGAFTGACWHEGSLYIMNSGVLSRLREDGTIEDLVSGLPWGDHQPNYPVVGPDGKLYWGQGTVTNAGVVGPDDYAYGFLKVHPDWHDVPGEDVKLVGRNYEYRDILGNLGETVRTGAYVPYDTETEPGQIIEGRVKCSGAVLRCNPDGSDLELVAWGLRNPYGTAFHPDGRLFVTEHGIDERGVRYIIGDYDDFYEIDDGAWYGWPDFASGIRLDDPYWGARGRGREPVLAEHPDPAPPWPFVSFPAHVGSNGVDFCSDPAFGFEGDAFVALFGDLAPVTTRKVTPAGFKVVRVDMQDRQVVDFAVNRFTGAASQAPHKGFERPSHCQFGPDGALYVVDWGEIVPALDRVNVRERFGTGALWRIRPTGGTKGERPPQPIEIQRLAVQGVAALAGFAAGLAGGLLIGRLLSRKGGAGGKGNTR
ncbi:MAG TPA: PQQ-dependent sugar dehydrogenase [Trueperaceae bacterium]